MLFKNVSKVSATACVERWWGERVRSEGEGLV
jgi:hypothetical protein